MNSFGNFISKRDRDNREHLKILGTILKKAGFKITPHLDDPTDPYFYIHKPTDLSPLIEDLTFGGLRVYARGKDIICYRVQQKHDVEPYGTSYNLSVQDMYKEMLDEDEKKLPYLIIYHIVNELKNFFLQSANDENEMGEKDSQMGSIVASGNAIDYSSQVTAPQRN